MQDSDGETWCKVLPLGQRVLLAKYSHVITPEHEILPELTYFYHLQHPSCKIALESQAGLNKYLNKQSTGVQASGQQFSLSKLQILLVL